MLLAQKFAGKRAGAVGVNLSSGRLRRTVFVRHAAASVAGQEGDKAMQAKARWRIGILSFALAVCTAGAADER
jgi:hypothetical protein